MPTARQTTILLARAADGDRAAADELLPHIYEGMRKLAADCLRGERPNHSLQPTALANEAFVRLVGRGRLDVQSRAHFFALAARCMRRILVNHAVARKAAKRGGGAATMTLDAEPAAAESSVVDILALDEVLTKLTALDPRKAQVVEHRFFGGMTTQETAQVLGVSVSTVEADWRTARAWLLSQLEP